MKRLLTWFGCLAIPGTVYGLMIYSPETIHPVFEYFSDGGNSRYIWLVFNLIVIYSGYIGLQLDIDSKKVSALYFRLIKCYFAAGAIAMLIYTLLSHNYSWMLVWQLGLLAYFVMYIPMVIYAGKKPNKQINQDK